MNDAAARARQILKRRPRAERVAIDRKTLAALLPSHEDSCPICGWQRSAYGCTDGRCRNAEKVRAERKST